MPSFGESLETRVSRLEEHQATQAYMQDKIEQLEQRLEAIEYHRSFSTGSWTPDAQAYYCPYLPLPSNNINPTCHDLRPKHLHAMKDLMCLRQTKSVEHYAITFQELAQNLELDQPMLIEIFYLGLTESIQELMAPHGSFISLEHFIEKCVAVEGTVEYSNVHREGPLAPEERQRRIEYGLCLYCGGFGHRS
ncbi:Retrotransposon-derived protein peg10, partial [Linderina pennispora]